MWGIFPALAAALALIATAARAAPSPASNPVGVDSAQVKAAQARVDDANGKAKALDPGGVLRDLTPIVMTPAFSRLAPQQQALGLYLLAWAALSQKDDANAHGAAVRSVELDPDNDQAWLVRGLSAWGLKDWDDEALSFAKLARKFPGTAASLPDGAVFNLAGQLHGQRLTEVMLALHDAHWTPKGIGATANLTWFTTMTDLLAQGDLEHAQLVAHDITGYREFIAMHADHRYDQIVSADPAAFDVSAGLDRELARRRADAAAFPTKLAVVNALAFALMERNAPGEALDVLQAALAKANGERETAAYFEDERQELAWTFDYESRAMLDLGRVDQAIKALEWGAALRGTAAPNVNQTLNLAELLDDLGRPREALKVIANFDSRYASPYGAMTWRTDVVCAYAQTNDAPKVAASLDYLKAHAQDAPYALRDGLICVGDADGYARWLLAGLDDPQLRATVLLRLQDFLPDPPNKSAWRESRQAFERGVEQRADVQAAIAKYGRIGSYPVRPMF